MQFKFYVLFMKAQKFAYKFLSTKTTREKYLICTAISLCIVFVILDFVYMPLFERYRALSTLHTHTQREFILSADSMLSAKNAHLEQMQSLQTELSHLESSLAPIQRYISTQEPPFNPFAFMPVVIDFVKNSNLTLTSFTPYQALNALNIEGTGHFDDMISLLSFIESYPFLSIDFFHLAPRGNADIAFDMLIVDYRSLRQEPPTQEQIREAK